MIYKEKGKEEHTLISLLPEEELGWSDERRHARKTAHLCRIPMDAVSGWRRLTSPDTHGRRRPPNIIISIYYNILYSNLLVRSPKS
jgi:hypothetical protein